MIGKTLGSYEILDRLGEGGMGIVYRAVHPLMGRPAAIKLLLPEYSKNKAVVERFFNEAKAAARIKHGGIVDMLDFGYAEDGSAYIIMELLEGEGLTERLARGPMAEYDILRLGKQMASALAAAHRAGIVHRDLKPDNVFVVPDSEVAGGERIKILDFGIAKLTGTDNGVSKTRTGVMMGSPMYMSPEQCKGASDVDARSDVYALACVLYHMATGAPPFSGEGLGEIIGKHMYEEPVAPSARVSGVSEGLDQLIMDGLRKKPEERLASMDAVMARIDQFGEIFPGGSFAGHTPAGGVPVYRPEVRPPTAPAVAATTLGMGAGQREVNDSFVAAGTGQRWKVPVLVLAAAAAGAVAVALSLGGGGGEGSAGSDGTSGAAEPPMAAVAPPVVEPDPVQAAPVPDAAVPEPAPAPVDIAIRSKPKGAEVFIDGESKRLGRTPLRKTVPADSLPLALIVRRSGYEDERVVVSSADKATFELSLQRKSRAKPAPTKTAAPVPAAKTVEPVKAKPKPGSELDDDGSLNPF